MTFKLPRRRGAPYTFAEVEVIFLVRRSPDAAQELATEFERTPGAIQFAWRWMDADLEGFPPRAFNRLYRLILRVRRKLGQESRGAAIGVTSARQWLVRRRVS
jgi:hypothetical protein